MTATGLLRTRAPNRLAIAAVFALACLVFAAALWESYRLAGNYYQSKLRREARPTLELYVSSLNGILEKYSVLPGVFAREPAIRAALLAPDDASARMRANVVMEDLNGRIGALDVFLMDTTGLTMAASNWEKKKTFVGNNYSYRPYFREAMEGEPGRYFAVGTTTGRRGYFLSSAVRIEGRIRGVVVVKVDLSQLKAAWAPTEDKEVFVTDENGVVILASRPDWLYRMTRPLTPKEVARIAQEQKYAGKTLSALPFRDDDYVVVQTAIPDHRFSFSLLTSTSTVARQVWNVVLTVCLSLLVFAVVVYAMYLWRRHHLRELGYQTQLNSELEIRVEERTRKLQEMNVSLQSEIVERQRAEADLHKAQDELVQAGKLAALGTMSASISHELNQPLGAINSFAANARLLLERDRPADAVDTLGHISEAAARAARIVENLRAFVRRERKAPVEVDLSAAVFKALDDAQPLLVSQGVEVVCTVARKPLPVRGGPARISQVFDNVITNAVLAMADAPARKLTISSQRAGGAAIVTFSDTGPGFSAEALRRAKEPFFTTRAQAEGLGLGLAICENIMETLDGTIEIGNETGSAGATGAIGGCVRLAFTSVDQDQH